MKVLITAGGTAEPVDGVRCLTNFSTGHTGAVLANAFKGLGAEVLLLRAAQAEPAPNVRQEIFSDFKSLDEALRRLLGQEKFDLVVHAAAVADFTVGRVEIDGKFFVPADLPKITSGSSVKLHLVPTYKIIDRLPSYACRRPFIVGFKLTNGCQAPQAAQAALKVKADLVVQNDLTDIHQGKRLFALFCQGEKVQQLEGTTALAKYLAEETSRRSFSN